ncbi:MAG: Molybdopterin dehydrogenase [Deltaproteobacteria bacterium]|nr:Molybdopterin dehydrogenase [Deltaproteobacteria bacterium]
MAIIQDMMPAFELFQPASVNDALALVNRHDKDAWVMGGGMAGLRTAPKNPRLSWTSARSKS